MFLSQLLASSWFRFFYRRLDCLFAVLFSFFFIFLFFFNHATLEDLDFVWGQEMHDFVNSIIRDYDPVGESSLAQQQQQDDYGTEIAGETPVGENVSGSFQSMVNTVHEAPAPAMDECVGEAPKKTYASVVCTSSVIIVCVACLGAV